VREMISSPWSADRSRARAGTEWTGVQMPSKYAGHLPWMQIVALNTIMKHRNAMPSAHVYYFYEMFDLENLTL